MKLNLGSGKFVMKGYTNVDKEKVHPDIFVADICDLPKTWTDKVDEIWCAGVLEHMTPPEVNKALSEMLRVLKPKARASLIVPDLEYACQIYFSAKDDTELKNWALFMIYGLQYREGQFHKCGFSLKSFKDTVVAAGFHIVGAGRGWNYNQCIIQVDAVKETVYWDEQP